jgi:hypothetical protein
MLNVICEKCLSRLPNDNLKIFSRCPVCRTSQKVMLFSAIEKEPEKGELAESVMDDNAACINHPDKAAAALCDGCGAYVCNLCEIEIEDQHLCPVCFNNNSGKITTLNKRTVLHDSCALSIAVFPMLIWPFTAITAFVAIFWAMFHWNKVNTPYKRHKWRFVVACLVATAQLIGWGLFIVLLVDG